MSSQVTTSKKRTKSNVADEERNEEESATTSKTPNAQTSSSDNDNKLKERQERLKQLKIRQNQARQLNRKEVIEEDRKAKLPSNWEKQKERLELDEEKETRRKEIEESGKEYERVRALEWTADECDAWERKRLRKHNPDTGFADFEQATYRQYDRLSKQIEPDMENYEKQKKELGEEFYATANSLIYGSHKPSSEAVDKMVNDVKKQIDKRQGYSRQRADKPNADIDYINDRNMRFNKKIDKFYGKYTTEIKQNLERGTAI